MGGVIVFVIKNNIFYYKRERFLRETEHLYRGTERNI